MQDSLSELCVPWPERCDEYVSPACWIKRTVPDPTLPGNVSLRDPIWPQAPYVARHPCPADGRLRSRGGSRKLHQATSSSTRSATGFRKET